MPLVDDWAPDQTPPAFRGLYVESLASQPHAAADAAIPVERIGGEVLVVGGEDDQVWPGAEFARAVARRRHEHGRDTTVVTHPHAGHRVIFPGESPAAGGRTMARGGTASADAELGALAWPHVSAALRLDGQVLSAR